jgi:hypothetical protein
VVSGYGTWLPGYFSAAELGQPDVSGPTSDPDLDGVPNLAEFAFGTSPRVGSGLDPALPRVEIVSTGAGKQRALFFQRPISRVGQVVYQGEWSADLKSWHPFGLETVLSLDSGIETVRILDPQPPAIAPRRLYRIRVTSVTP